MLPVLKWLADGQYLEQQLASFTSAGPGYRVSVQILDARNYGVPAERKRIFIVGVRSDLAGVVPFPVANTRSRTRTALCFPMAKRLSIFLSEPPPRLTHRAREPFSWWYMSRKPQAPLVPARVYRSRQLAARDPPPWLADDATCLDQLARRIEAEVGLH